MKKEILAIIPARKGSKGIPGKNIKLLAGKPLICYTIDAAKKSKRITKIILSSDSLKIIKYCKQKGIEAPFIRPKRIAADNTPMVDVVRHTLSYLKEKKGYIPEYIILLQPTSPLRKTKDIDKALNFLVNSRADSVVSVTEVPHNFNPYSVMRFDGAYLKPFLKCQETYTLRQNKPKFYARNGPAILAFTYNCIVNKNSLYGDKILAYFMKQEENIDIDEEFHFKLVEDILMKPIC